MSVDNLSLWRSVETTPLDQTKAITGKAYKGTSPKPYYLIKKATETFGPIGIGWGFKIIEEGLQEGAIVVANDGHAFRECIHVARVAVWYKWDGVTSEPVEHVGQTVFCGVRKNGAVPFTDEDAPKKSVTDALTKALSMIGFCGDIFMGRYDDSKYIADLKEEEAAKQYDDELRQERDDIVELIGKCRSLDDLKDLWQTPRVKKFRNGGSNPHWPDVEAEKDARKAVLQLDDNPFQDAAE